MEIPKTILNKIMQLDKVSAKCVKLNREIRGWMEKEGLIDDDGNTCVDANYFDLCDLFVDCFEMRCLDSPVEMFIEVLKGIKK